MAKKISRYCPFKRMFARQFEVKLKTEKSIGNVVIKNRHLMRWGACLRTTFSYYSRPRFFASWFTQKGRIPNGTVSDAPCGDMTWMSLFLRGRKDVDYTGNIYKSHFLKFFIFTYINNYLYLFRALSILHGKFVFSGYDIIPMNIENAKSNFSSGTLSIVQSCVNFNTRRFRHKNFTQQFIVSRYIYCAV